MAKLVFIPGLLCTDILFTPQISALQDEVEISIAETTGMDSITQMAERLLDEQNGSVYSGWLVHGRLCGDGNSAPGPGQGGGLGLLSTAADQDTEKEEKASNRAYPAVLYRKI